jgi:hypothetical protein
VQRSGLPHIGVFEIHLTRRKSFVETNLPHFHVLDAKEHTDT